MADSRPLPPVAPSYNLTPPIAPNHTSIIVSGQIPVGEPWPSWATRSPSSASDWVKAPA